MRCSLQRLLLVEWHHVLTALSDTLIRWAIRSGLYAAVFHSEVATVLLDDCVLPLTLSKFCLQVLGWHPNDAYRNNTKLGLSDTTYTCTNSIMTRFLIHLPDYKAKIQAVDASHCTWGQEQDRMHYSLCFPCSPTTGRLSDQKTSKLQQRKAFK